MIPIIIVAGSLLCGFVQANDAKIIDATIQATGGGKYRISVTLRHDDTGWDHYANRWDVLNEKGELLGSRTLAHPHVNEQPFTRSLTLKIPAGVEAVTIVASDSVHGDNAETFTLAIPE
ncbi:hypothetical protein AB833_29900 [Chromatiales bacterium (ex Bugula neritina AB1)]|nr:hypothetical protein AB833_29900 [Chromatiales bacterium (ex Bugula neritina AB1)]